MYRSFAGVLIVLSLAVVLPLGAVASAQPAPATAWASSSCHLSGHDQRHLGASYVTSLSVKNTSCAVGKQVTLGFNKCRTSGGKPQGKCTHKVNKFRCSEKRYDAVPGVQYSSKVTCVRGSKKVFSTYTQNT